MIKIYQIFELKGFMLILQNVSDHKWHSIDLFFKKFKND